MLVFVVEPSAFVTVGESVLVVGVGVVFGFVGVPPEPRHTVCPFTSPMLCPLAQVGAGVEDPALLGEGEPVEQVDPSLTKEPWPK